MKPAGTGTAPPSPYQLPWPARLLAAFGAFVGIALTGLAGQFGAEALQTSLWLVPPMGATAVLVFVVPQSPLATPWAVMGGNTVSALLGVGLVHLGMLWPMPVAVWAGLAVGLSIVLMFALRCLHPPGGATALLMVLLQIKAPWYALFPVLVNSACMVGVARLWNWYGGRAGPAKPES
jgi:CBS domain-containing membrane protein